MSGAGMSDLSGLKQALTEALAPWIQRVAIFNAVWPLVAVAVEEVRKDEREKVAQQIEREIAELERPNAGGLIHACEELRLMVAVARGSVPVKEHSDDC